MKNFTHAFTRSAALVCTAGIFAFLSACGGGGGGGSGSSGNTSGSNTAVTTTFTIPELEGTVSGANRVVTHQAYQYTAVSATTTAANYTVDWGDGSPPITQWANATTQTKVWRKAGSPVGTLTKLKVDGSTFSATQTVVVVDQPISGGNQHSCAILTDSTVACWGANTSGQLGLGSTTAFENVPNIVPNLSNVVSLAAFGASTCAAKTNGSVWCWGNTDFTREGAITSNRQVPQQVAGLSNIVSLGGGGSHVCAVDQLGAVFCWGRNFSGQLGNGTVNNPLYTTDSLTPVAVTGLTDVRQVAGGAAATCAIVGDAGNVKCWGGGPVVGPNRQVPFGNSIQVAYPVDVPNITGAVNLSFGNRALVCATLVDGTVKCWGIGLAGQNSSTPVSEVPTTIAGLTGIASVNLGDGHACAIKKDRTVICWGNPNSVGNQNPTVISAQTQVLDAAGGNLSDVLALGIGWSHSCALKTDGTVKCWHQGVSGTIGDGQNLYRADATTVSFVNVGQVPIALKSQSLALGGNTSCAVKSDGNMTCWGDGSYGVLGDGLIDPHIALGPVDSISIPGLSNLVSGLRHSCGVTSSGNVLCWGVGFFGALGNGTSGNKSAPTTVIGIGGQGVLTGVTALGATSSGTCAVFGINRNVACWGRGAFGMFDPQDLSDSLAPKLIAGLSDVISVAGGVGHTCALKNNGDVYCWGLINNSYIPPTLVSNLSNVVSISSSYAHMCALKTDKTVSCWGTNWISQTPTVVAGLTDAIAIASAGAAYWQSASTCAIRLNTEVVCFGVNAGFYSELGAGYDYIQHNPVPTAVTSPDSSANLTGITQIAGGLNHYCVLKQPGDVFCWGDNSKGQLGAGQLNSPVQSNLPLKVQVITAAQPRTFWR